MGRTVKQPKKFIVSCRVDDEEMRLLVERARSSHTSISELLRRSLELCEEHPALEKRHASATYA
ncbi:transcriptional regulator [Desulfuromonas soudanensis]|uniref:Transcriptional regulator n=1 Tax=Desulfuromonas soudanensis TaxID=1603606 RepID=A0A0M3QEW0_9BACT|nr:ribbon-helix-helix protein, CopG family [Desulfuromonas soudanensis]ALC15169.1 transcriptional regulator [Desulfuromonas soudanensis]